MINKESYITEKFIYLIIFGGTIDDCFNQEWMKDDNILFSLRTVIKELTKYNYLSDNVKNSLYEILSNCRDIKTDNYEERIEIINTTIGLLNCQIEDNSFDFYVQEMKKRYRTLYNLDDAIEQEINESIVYDFPFLQLHLLNSDNFLEYKQEFSDYPRRYLLSLNAIMSENPYIFKDDNFTKNVCDVLSLIEKDKEFSGVKKLQNKIKKMEKKLGNT